MSNKCRFIGRVVCVGATEKLGSNPEKPFYKRTIVVDDADGGSKYPNAVPFEYTGDKVKYLDGYNVGETVTIDFYPNGRAWQNPKTGKTQYFCSNRIAYIQKGAASAEAAPAESAGLTPSEQADAEAQAAMEVSDDMPF